MSRIKLKMLPDIPVSKIQADENKQFVTAKEKAKLNKINHGSEIYNGTNGVLIEHNLGITEHYTVVITNLSNSDEIGKVWIESKTENSFIVRNSGICVGVAFDWGIVF